MGKLETIAIIHPDGKNVIRINVIDFDESIHQPASAQASERIVDVTPLQPSSAPPSPMPPADLVTNPPPLSPREAREMELLGMDWRELKAIAESFVPPIEKPVAGWDEAVSLILDQEFPPS